MTTAEIESLLERVRKATGSDRELDDAIAAVVGGWHRGSFDWYDHAGKRRNQSPTFTASIDAAVALIERVLPGWLVCIDQLSDGWDASLVEYDRASKMITDDYSAEAKTAPLALLESLLLALLHQASDSKDASK